MEIFFVIFQFHYRNRQQELMDHKREICCWNNDYLLYLTNLKRGRYNSSVTQHEKVNGWESEVEFTLRKFTAVLWIRSKVTGSQDKMIKCAMFYRITKEGLVIGWFPGCDHWDGVWGAGCMSGIHHCERKGKIQDWAAEKRSCPAGLLWGTPAHVLCPVPDVKGPRWGRRRRLLTRRLFTDHTPHTWSQWASPSLKWDVGAHLSAGVSLLNVRDFLRWCPYNRYSGQCMPSVSYKDQFTFFKHIDEKSPFNIFILFASVLLELCGLYIVSIHSRLLLLLLLLKSS